MGQGSFAYYLFFVLHLMSVIVGIGGVILNGLYGAKAKADQGPGGLAISRANEEVSTVAEKVIFTIPLWGIILLFLSDGAYEITQLWVLLSIGLYVLAVGIGTGILAPTHRRLNTLLEEMTSGPPPVGGPPPQLAEVEKLGAKLGMFGGITGVLAVALVTLMVWKPGL